MIVAIDGPAATGKSTSAKLVAQKLSFTYLDTGAMYRCVTLAVLRDQISLDDERAFEQLLKSMNIQLDKTDDRLVVHLNGEDVSTEIRKAKVTSQVSAVSALPQVRSALVDFQRNIAKDQNCVMEGRDIGTVVFPNAEFKFFLIADDKIRAERRQLDLLAIGEKKSIDELVEEIRQRDALDSGRSHSPLRKADDAIEVDTSKMTINEQVDFMVNKVKTLTIGN
ncbi:MAG: (d)CMP kinase [Candidatus Marinimicrobia bacterium]|jgi:cytidylate kinase|nr:(d)CMP kinase [Candidatus Neomarinimicrobiota bacterium]MBT3675342.1 (d)CMP kinase [Candidatus Neomarinimicrobiota bacterium]MBT3763156.1 (d)CMP kinase [Candidatus Neomarinimicrobiota bacterium]MBT4068924.1 (d)CMP kinase [Candidatus Neomarinimicrobiota bacterium]MBT4270817.1 (d)CMP kinase [Candidatus Neomarinimicrobiota bacterium]